MGEKEDRLRKLRRKVFARDGWQDEHGTWYALCAIPQCEAVVPWFGTGLIKLDPNRQRTLDNVVVRCNDCGRHGRVPAKLVAYDRLTGVSEGCGT